MSSPARILSTMVQEIRIARRNRWAILAILLLSVFALSLALFAAGQSGQVKADTLTLTAASLATLSVYLIPLIALLISYDAFSGEVERGTLALLLATPLKRSELFLAKLLAQVAVVGVAVFVGYGIAALAVALVEPPSQAGVEAWARLIATSVLLGAIFVGFGMLVSAAMRRTGAAAAVAVGLWLMLVVLYDIALLGGLVAGGDGAFANAVFPWLVLANPADAYRLFNLVLLDGAPVSGLDGIARTLPVPPAAMLGILLAWLAGTVLAGMAATRRITP
jgi:Cu-processing system permease protein